MWYKLKQKFIDLNDDCDSQSQLVLSARGSHILKFLFIEIDETSPSCFYVLLTVHFSIILDNDQLDTHWLYFTIHLL